MSKKLLNILNKILFIIIIILILCLISRLFLRQRSIKTLNNQVNIINQYHDNTIDKLKEYYHNNDIVGVLKIDNLKINAVITKSNDNSFYLKHNVYGKYDIYGNVFVDYRIDLNKDRQINIYGHSDNRQSVPFSKIIKYLDYNTYKENKYITLQTDKNIKKYEIFAVDKINDNNAYHMDLSISDDKWLDHLNKFKDNSIYKTDTNINKNDRILVLQTCLPHDNYDYIVVVAKEIK